MKHLQRLRDRIPVGMGALVLLTILVLMMSACSSTGNDDDALTQVTGFIEAKRFSVSSETGGLISQILVAQGEEVLQDELVIIIDSSLLEELLIQGEAALTLAEAQLTEINSRPHPEDIAAADALLADAYAGLVSAQAALETLEEVYKPYDPPDRDLHAAESGVAIAEANYDLVKAQLDQVIAGPFGGEIIIAEVSVEEASVNLELIQLQIERSKLYSPISGVIDQLLIHVGETAFPGMSLIEVIDPQNLTLTVFVPVTDVVQVSLSQQVDITVDAYPDRTFYGEVTRIADQAQFTPTNVQTTEERVKLVFAVEIKVDNTENLLHAGMPADVNFAP